MSKWDEPIKPEALFILVFVVAILCMAAAPLAFVFASLASLVGLGGTQDTRTILASFALVLLLGIALIVAVAFRLNR